MNEDKRRILVTSALPYANGAIHLGHMLEYIQTDVWARFQRAQGHECYFAWADDAHGTPVMLWARREGKTPEELRYWVQLPGDLAAFPNNQLTYGELSYYPPYIYNHALGWFCRDVTTLNRIAPQQQAEKIVEGFGGVQAVKEDVAESIKAGELAWAELRNSSLTSASTIASQT